MTPEQRAKWAALLRGGAQMLDDPKKWEEFKDRFGLAATQSLFELAKQRGMDPELVELVKRNLGL